jgi:hypothetical protein
MICVDDPARAASTTRLGFERGQALARAWPWQRASKKFPACGFIRFAR